MWALKHPWTHLDVAALRQDFHTRNNYPISSFVIMRVFKWRFTDALTLGISTCMLGIVGRISKGTNIQLVAVIMDDLSWLNFMGATKADSGKDYITCIGIY